jgi:hypothetical protein
MRWLSKNVWRYPYLFYFALPMLVLMGFGFWMQSLVWNECRASGHSVFYCLYLLSW